MKISKILLFFGLLAILTACEKDDLCVGGNYTGTVLITSGGQEPAGDFIGNKDSGCYSFSFNNPETRVEATFDITTVNGSSVQMIIRDAASNVVLDQTLVAGTGDDSFSDLSSSGQAGQWTVILNFVDFDGDGSYSISPE
jgi:TPP-dependent indolepyruvate ferredoxin oxidoreductase alpha subunit